MACINPPITNFGVHQVTFSDIDDRSIMGTAKIIDVADPAISQEMIPLNGGSSAFKWASAPGLAEGTIALTIKQYDKNILKFLNANTSDYSNIEENSSGDAAGYTSAITNSLNESVVDSVTGIVSIAVDSSTVDTLAFGDYALKAVSAVTFDLYLNTDVSGKAAYIDENLKINETPITLPTASTVVSNGIEFTGGSAPAMTIGDVAIFSVRPINSYNLINYIGKTGAVAKEFRIDIISEIIGDKIRMVTYPRVLANDSAHLKFPVKEFSMIEATLDILQPCVEDYVGVETYLNR